MKSWPNRSIPGTAVSLFLATCLTACGGGGSDSGSEGDIATTPPPTSGGNPPPPPPPAEEGPILQENFGDGLFVNFDAADTIYFFSADYKTLAANNPQDPRPSFYYPTCCFFANDKPADGPEVNLDQMGIVNDSGNPSMLLNTGRFTAGQNLPDADKSDPKKDSTTNEDTSTWGELNLSEPYRISFCVKEATGSRNMQIYVDNNTSGEANSYHGGGSQGSRIFNMPVNQLVPGTRVVVNIPGDTLVNGALADTRPVLVGTGASFLQFRVEGGSSVIFDDLLVEYQDDDGQADLPACNTFIPATPPDAPEAPTLSAGDAQITASWSEVIGAVRYDLAYNTVNSLEGATTISGESFEGTRHTLEGLTNGTEYFVFLRVTNSAGTGEWSAAASATPVEPLGCAVSTPDIIDTDIAWSVYDGCVAPDVSGALVLNATTSGELSYPGESDSKPEVRFTANKNGTSTLNTTANADARSKGDLANSISNTDGYPQHFTLIARVRSPGNDNGVRGLEVETVFANPSDRRVKLILRPDQGPTDNRGRIQLERFMNFGESSSSSDDTTQADVPMTDDYHIYHVSYTLEDPALVGTNNLTARVYRDGANVSNLFNLGVSGNSIVGTGRSGGAGANRLRIGEDASSGYAADVDWIVWSNDVAVATKTAAQLAGELPGSIGELGFYADNTNLILSENFDGASDGDGSTSSFFTVAYKSISTDANSPFYSVANATTRIAIAGGTLQYYNARVSLGDANPEAGATTSGDTVTRGDLDLSAPYRITFEVLTNDNTAGKCQVYADNNTSSSSNSIHPDGTSKIFEKDAVTIADNNQPTGTVTIESDVGTETSFITLRCDGSTTTPITIDNLVIERQ